MPSTPPSKRHHLPFAMALNNGSNGVPTISTTFLQPQASTTTRCSGNIMNQVFIATCIASFLLQLIGLIVTWQQHHHFYYTTEAQRELLLMNPQQQQQQQVAQQHALASLPLSILRQLEKSNEAFLGGVPPEEEYRQKEQDSLNNDDLPGHLSFGAPHHSRRLRVLFGILTADFPNDRAYRKRHRDLFALWDDPRVCSLPDFKAKPMTERYKCQLIYTFVMGANPDAAPELVDDSRPMQVPRPVTSKISNDINNPDTVLLNIRENMNEGKSQTWLKYGAELAARYDLDYVVKCDADAILHLHEFFTFAYKHLPPAPYNRNVYVGALRDKAYWPRHKTEDERIRFESFFGNNYEGVHLYVAGQIYIVSTDLANFIGQEALRSQCSYCEGHEDHDISAMAFHSPQPVNLQVIGRSHRFWEHPVKGEPRWRRIWARESARMQGIPFEGKIFSKNSTIENALGLSQLP